MLERFSQSIDATPEERITVMGEIDLRESVAAPGGRTAFAMPASSRPEEPSDAEPRPSTDEHDYIPPEPEPITSRRAPAPPGPEVIDRYETRLSRMGLPARLIPRGVAQHELKGALVESLTRLPPAPSIPPALGVVIVVTGVGAAPVLLAREFATELMLDPDDVVLATREQLGFGIPAWLQMSDAATAQERRRSWRRRTRPTIVACSLPSVAGLRWAREMLDNLEPTVTWAIVDASWKREDIAQRVEALGGIDALALDGLEETVSPAAVLDLGVPVGRLEHELASPLTWAELLLERLS